MLALTIAVAAALTTANDLWIENGDDLQYRRWVSSATNAASLLETMPVDCALRRKLDVIGTVTARTPEGFVLHDASGDALLECRPGILPIPGDTIRAKGVIHHFRRNFQKCEARQVERIKSGVPTEPIVITPRELARGTADFRRVVLEGVVTDASRDEIDHPWCWLLVCRDGEEVAVCLRDPDIREETLDGLVDAKVSVCGVAMPVGAGARRNLGVRISVMSIDDIKITEPPPNPFVGKTFSMFLEPAHTAHETFEHRRKVNGTVIVSWGGRHLFIETDGRERLRVNLKEKTRIPLPGAKVSVAGFVRKNTFFSELHNAVLRAETGDVVPIDETPVDIGDSFGAGQDVERRFVPQLEGRLVRLRGRCASTMSSGNQLGLFWLDCGGDLIQVKVGEAMSPPMNAEIEVLGICIMSVESPGGANGFGRIIGFAMATRSPADIHIVHGPPWWTPAKLAAVVATLIALIALLVLRGKLKERMARRDAQLRLDERTRLAVELHDSLAQNLTGVSLQLDAAEMAEADRKPAGTYIENAREALRSCREGLRYCLSDLRSRSFEDTDMTEAIAETVHPHIGKAFLCVRFNVPRSLLSDTSSHAVLCIVRELAVNAARHGNAKHVHVAGEFRDGIVRFSVSDDGCGFNPETCPGPAQGHFGLLGVRERVQALNGTIAIDSSPQKGSKVTISLKLNNRDVNWKNR